MKNLVLRSVSGIVYVALIVAATLAGSHYFTDLLLLFGILAVIEFERITVGSGERGLKGWIKAADIAATMILIVVANFFNMPDGLVMAFVVYLLLYSLIRFTIALYDKSQTAFVSCAWSLMSVLYIATPLAMLNALPYFCDRWQYLVLAMFIMIWLNDTGAYCVGSLIGRHKMFPRLSPKKSWEGWSGGFVFCLAAGIAANYIIPGIFTLPVWIAFGAMVCVLSTWGDLFESLLKRSHGIKDSGNIIPGHGGILDRIDSLLFVATGTFVFVLLLV